jgi:hypothetical protein
MANYPDYTNAACKGLDTELFYDWSDSVIMSGDYDDHDSLYRAPKPATYGMLRRLCLSCPVLQECREWAIAHEEYGFWGGMSPIERESERSMRGVRLQTPLYEVMVTGRGSRRGFYARQRNR